MMVYEDEVGPLPWPDPSPGPTVESIASIKIGMHTDVRVLAGLQSFCAVGSANRSLCPYAEPAKS